MTKSHLMKPVSLPPRKAGRPKSAKSDIIVARRKQLRENPNQWFLFDGDAKFPAGINNVVANLMGLPTNIKMNRKEWEIKGATRKNPNGKYSLYVGYFPKEDAF